jgi:hypothetical protein
MHGRRSTRSLFTALAAATVIAAGFTFGAATASASHATSHLSGGGTASISQVAFNVTINGSGSASGSFECLMAGRSSFVLGAFGLAHIMQVHATPTGGSINGSVVSFTGSGQLIMDGGQHQSIDISVWANVATQQFQLTVVQVGAMPVESFMSGGISLR